MSRNRDYTVIRPSATGPPLGPYAETSPDPPPTDEHRRHFTDSVLKLRHLSSALSSFHRHYDDLQSHLDFINTSIDELSKKKCENQSLYCDQTQILTRDSDQIHNAASDQTLIPDQTQNSPSTKTVDSGMNHIDPLLTTDNSEKTQIPPSSETLDFDQTQNTPLTETRNLEKTQNAPPTETLDSDETQNDSSTETHSSEKTQNVPSTKTWSSDKTQNAPAAITLNSEQSEIVTLCKSMNGDGLRKYVLTHLSDATKLVEEVPRALKVCPNSAKLVLDCLGDFYKLGNNAYRKNPSLNRSRQASILMLEFYLLVGCDVSESETEDLVRDEAELAAVAWRKRLIDEHKLSRASEIDAKGLLLFIGCFGVPSVFEDDDVLDLVRASNGKEISDLLQKSSILIKKMKEIIEVKQKKGMEVDAFDIALTFHLEVRYSPQSILASFLRNSKKAWKFARKSLEDNKLHSAYQSFKKQLVDLNALLKCFEKHNLDPSKFQAGWHPTRKMASIEREIAEMDKKRKEKAEAKRIAESSKKLNKKEAKRPRVGSDPQKNADFEYNNNSSSVLHRNAAAPLPGVRHSFGGHRLDQQNSAAFPIDQLSHSPHLHRNNSPIRPYHYTDALLNERIAGRNYIISERFLGHSFVEPVGHGVDSLSRPDLLPYEYMRYSNPSPAASSNPSRSSDLYGFADAVLDRGAYGGSRTSGIGSSVPSVHRPSYL